MTTEMRPSMPETGGEVFSRMLCANSFISAMNSLAHDLLTEAFSYERRLVGAFHYRNPAPST
jgi:hypothetical protein